MNRMNYDDFSAKFGKWAEKFRPFIESEDFYNIYQRLKKDSDTETIVPNSDVTFRSFATTDPKDIKVIWYLMDPYPRQYKKGLFQATGIAMDCTNSPDGKLQPSLIKFYDAIAKELKEEVEYTPSLEYLHQQGCMMLNTDLTCKLNKTGSHSGVWSKFQQFFLEEVMAGTTGIIYVLAGDESNRMERFINPLGNYIFKVSHPNSAFHKNTDWDSQGIFTKINKLLLSNNGTSICWNKKTWDLEPPF